MLEIRDLHFAHHNRPALFNGLNFIAQPGEVLALIGRNGAGKSTLIRLINGLAKPSRGEVLLDGDGLTGLRADQLAGRVATLFQTPEQQIFHDTVEAEVMFGLKHIRLDRTQVQQRVEDALRRTDLLEQARRHPLDLDHASRRMVAMASLLARTPRVILLDEPQRGLDARMRARMSRLIEQERQRGAIQILICHDMEFVARHADDVLALHEAGPVWAEAGEFFADAERARRIGVGQPLAIELCQQLGQPVSVRLDEILDAWLGQQTRRVAQP